MLVRLYGVGNRRRPAALAQTVTHLQRERQRRTRVPGHHVLLQARRIAHPPGGAEVAWRHHGRETPLPGALGQPAKRLVDADLRDHLLPRRDVADLLGEQAATVLLQQAGRTALQQRLLEALARPCHPVHLADDASLADTDGETGHHAIVRQRQRVADGERVGPGVGEALLQHHPRQPATGIDPDAGGTQRQFAAVDGNQATTGNRFHVGIEVRGDAAHDRAPWRTREGSFTTSTNGQRKR